MAQLFNRGYLHDYLRDRIRSVSTSLDAFSDDEILRRTTDDLVAELVDRASLAPIRLGAELIDGGLTEGTVMVKDPFYNRPVQRRVFNVHATYELSGTLDLLYHKPSRIQLARFEAEIGNGTITVRGQVSAIQATESDVRASYEREITDIRANASYANNDAVAYNRGLDAALRPAVERRKELLQKKRDLAGALGFPLAKRKDSPLPVPMKRKVMGVQRAERGSVREPFRDEPALNQEQYEDAISVISSALLSMERTPTVVAGKNEEELRDYILVMLNGTFEGAATGETFVKKGKTDILIRVENRHVFVGECKWWKGAKALGCAVDQLLGYLPWRDEKAALIIFLKSADASAVMDKADSAIREHPSFKRVGKATNDPSRRRNVILGHPEDSEREIQVAVLFAVLTDTEHAGERA